MHRCASPRATDLVWGKEFIVAHTFGGLNQGVDDHIGQTHVEEHGGHAQRKESSDLNPERGWRWNERRGKRKIGGWLTPSITLYDLQINSTP